MLHLLVGAILLSSFWGYETAVLYDTRDSTLIEVQLTVSSRFVPLFVAVPDREEITVESIEAFDNDGLKLGRPSFSARKPAWLRDVRVLPIRIDVPDGASKLLVKLRYSGAAVWHPLRRTNRVSPEFMNFYRLILANPNRASATVSDDVPLFGNGADIVVITLDEFVPYIEPYVEWKREKGKLTRIYTTSEIGTSPEDIKAFLKDAYYNWEIPPEYVLIVSDTLGWTGTENYYGRMDDDDLNDIIPARLPASDTADLKTMVAKILAYEKEPFLDDSLWFRKATLIVREDDQVGSDTVYWNDVYYVADLMVSHGYVHVDTFWNDIYLSGPNDAEDVENAVTDGRCYVLFRGQGVNYWWYPFDVSPDNTANGRKLPVILSVTCSTANQDQTGFTWLSVGSPDSLKGAVGFYGTTNVGHGLAQERSKCARGFFESVFADSLTTFGLACEVGRLAVYNYSGDLMLYDEWRTLGDPSMALWTSTPKPLEVNTPDSVSVEAGEMQVYVESNGQPVQGAFVSVLQDTLYIATGVTDAGGTATIPLSLNSLAPIVLTVTGYNLKPYQKEISVYATGPFIVLEGSSLDDSPGNGNGELNPGETARLNITISNCGYSDCHNLHALLFSDDPYVSIVDTSEFIGDVGSGETHEAEGLFLFSISDECPVGHELIFTVFFFDAEGDTWSYSTSPIEVKGASLRVTHCSIIDPPPGGNDNGILEPGEAAELIIELENTSSIDLHDLRLCFVSGNEDFVFPVEKTAFIPELPAGCTSSCDAFPLYVSVNPSTPVSLSVPWWICVEADAGTYEFHDTLSVNIDIGTPDSSSPTGPDNYGYFIYDDCDETSSLAPEYEWIEIAPPTGQGELVSEITNSNDDTTSIFLFFSFTFYGNSFNRLGISSNGLFEFGGSTYPSPENMPIPHSGPPVNFIAPFWDDLDPAAGGDIYKYYDYANHRWIIEFKNVKHHGSGSTETFQVILLDPSYYSTSSGDGELIIQYADLSCDSFCAVGMQGQDESTGLQYLFRGEYAKTASRLTTGRALRITTEKPNHTPAPWPVPVSKAFSDSTGGNGNNAIEPGETISLRITLQNRGDSAITNVTARLVSLDGDADVIDSTAEFGDLQPGEFAVNTEHPFVFNVAENPADSSLKFAVVIEGGDGYIGYAYLRLPLYEVVNSLENGCSFVGFVVEPPYPNPTRSISKISFSLPQRQHVTVKVYDASGRLVSTLFDRTAGPGRYTINWPAVDSRGVPLPSGVYFISVRSGKFAKNTKLVVIR